MIAKKCDICGILYEPYHYKNIDILNPNGFTFITVDNNQTYYNHVATDCCPDCMSKIKRFIYDLKGEKAAEYNHC